MEQKSMPSCHGKSGGSGIKHILMLLLCPLMHIVMMRMCMKKSDTANDEKIA